MATIFDHLFSPMLPDVQAAQRASLNEQLRQASSVAASPAQRGAANPLALSQAVAQAQSGARAANAAQFQAQLQAAQQADRQQGMQVLGTLGNLAGSAIGMAIPGAGAAVSPLAGTLGSALAKAPLAAAGGQALPPPVQAGFAPQEQGFTGNTLLRSQGQANMYMGRTPTGGQVQMGPPPMAPAPAPQAPPAAPITQDPMAQVVGGQPVQPRRLGNGAQIQWPWMTPGASGMRY